MIRRIFVVLLLMSVYCSAMSAEHDVHQDNHEVHQDSGHDAEEHDSEGGGHGHHSIKPAFWSVIPFVLLLVMIATGPLFYPHFWHKSYPVISIVLAFLVCTYYIFILHNNHSPVHSTAEYIQFIALLTGLFVAYLNNEK